MPTCPNGHQSGSDDWCEVCGHRMTGAGAPAGAAPTPPPPPPAPGYGYPPGPGSDATQQAELCPQCRTPREAMAPFCEECRWNFLTNTATSYTPLAPAHGVPGPPPGLNLPPGFQAQQPPAPQPRDPFEYQGSRPSQVNRPAEPLSSEPGNPPGPPVPGPGPQSPPVPGPQSPPPPFQQGPPPPSFQQQSAPPSPFQQQSAPPPFQQQSAPPAPQPPAPQPPAPQGPQPPAPPQGPQGGGDDDWMLSPPSRTQPPQQQPAPPQQGQPPFPGPGQNQPPASWTAVIAPDREYFLAMMQRSGPEATGLNLPAYSPEQQLPLSGNQVTVGRRRQSTGESPDIDLSVPPEDPGVSHQHAVLVQQPDGSWAVVDQNSTNGTTLNGAEDPIQPYVPVPLQDGDRVHVGAWTTITIRRG
ncbi:FHA domain-containing protein [Streptomyces atratus]|uniref:Forkhead associated (FHA) domain, binds pSer, pThr, pTyr n=1 Tax=Streptomyces atratus TaxID=1893 RepID=A0A1K2F3Q1_STRAR|nr:FHA domain-containing protein [Streptomyces atratus]SFY42403.1 Forkhead associated (FHA) domain, binds pSer, pThr, pTyr [Streptomyces atratus]